MQSAPTPTETTPKEIDITDPKIAWRYTCPRGHTTYEPTNGGIWCRSCELNDDIPESHYHEIQDKRRKELLNFDDVVLVEGQGE